jgi:hypothetical protein
VAVAVAGEGAEAAAQPARHFARGSRASAGFDALKQVAQYVLRPILRLFLELQLRLVRILASPVAEDDPLPLQISAHVLGCAAEEERQGEVGKCRARARSL